MRNAQRNDKERERERKGGREGRKGRRKQREEKKCESGRENHLKKVRFINVITRNLCVYRPLSLSRLANGMLLLFLCCQGVLLIVNSIQIFIT